MTQRMTAVITQMKTAPTAPQEPVILGNSSVTMDAASLRAGNVMWTMIVGTIQMSLFRSAWVLRIAVTITLTLIARQIIGASHCGLCATVMMTVGITRTKKTVNKEHVIHLGTFAARITAVFLCAGNVMETTTAAMDLTSATAAPGSAQKVNSDVIICTVFPAAGFVIMTTTVKITQMKEIAR